MTTTAIWAGAVKINTPLFWTEIQILHIYLSKHWVPTVFIPHWSGSLFQFCLPELVLPWSPITWSLSSSCCDTDSMFVLSRGEVTYMYIFRNLPSAPPCSSCSTSSWERRSQETKTWEENILTRTVLCQDSLILIFYIRCFPFWKKGEVKHRESLWLEVHSNKFDVLDVSYLHHVWSQQTVGAQAKPQPNPCWAWFGLILSYFSYPPQGFLFGGGGMGGDTVLQTPFPPSPPLWIPPS